MLAALAAIPAGKIPMQRFALDPSCRLLRSAFPVLRIWQAHQDDSGHDRHVEFANDEDFLLIRREDGRVVVERVERGDFAWLAALAAGADLGQGLDAAFDADATFDLGTALRTFIANGVLAAIVAAD
jgi:hypothetical protein